MAQKQLQILDHEAHLLFREAASVAGHDPDDRWVGGYVDYQWQHVRYLIESLPGSIAGKRVLEFGCNFGATSVVLARLGAQVTAVDINEKTVEIARLNARRYSVDHAIEFVVIPETTSLPYATGSFDLVTCISVLEYIPSSIITQVQREIDRTLKPGGFILVSGTSSRLWPREVHSRRWLVNYLPRTVFKSARFQQGISPWRVRNGFGQGYVNLDWEDGSRRFYNSRVQMGASWARRVLLSIARLLAHALRTSPGLLMPNISLTLRKEGERRQ